MIKKSEVYKISGQEFDKVGLKSFCLGKISVLGTPFWERDIWTFILKWLSQDEFVEVKTSGSTGEPKKIMLQKKYMEESAKATISFFGLKPGDSALLCLPIKYIAGKMMVVRALVGGLNLQLIEPSSAPDLINYSAFDFAALTPMQAVNMLKDKQGIANFEKIRKLILGGAALPPGLEKNLQGFKTEIWQTFGMTETITHVALRKVNGPDSSEWYQSLPGVSLSADERNCLVINYPKIGVENHIANDIIEFNKSGQFKLLGRFDNVVNSGGIKLFPEVIEKKIEEILDSEFYLVGQQDEILGEKMILLIEGNDPSKEQALALHNKIKTILSGFEVPKQIIFKKSFDRTQSGKVIRNSE